MIADERQTKRLFVVRWNERALRSLLLKYTVVVYTHRQHQLVVLSSMLSVTQNSRFNNYAPLSCRTTALPPRGGLSVKPRHGSEGAKLPM